MLIRVRSVLSDPGGFILSVLSVAVLVLMLVGHLAPTVPLSASAGHSMAVVLALSAVLAIMIVRRPMNDDAYRQMNGPSGPRQDGSIQGHVSAFDRSASYQPGHRAHRTFSWQGVASVATSGFHLVLPRRLGRGLPV